MGYKWDNKRKGGTKGGNTLEGISCNDNTQFLTSRKSELREAPRPDAPFPLVKSLLLASHL